MRKAKDGLVSFDGEKLIELNGFLTETGEIVLSDSDSIGDWEKVKVKITKSMLRFWLLDNSQDISEECRIDIFGC